MDQIRDCDSITTLETQYRKVDNKMIAWHIPVADGYKSQ